MPNTATATDTAPEPVAVQNPLTRVMTRGTHNSGADVLDYARGQMWESFLRGNPSAFFQRIYAEQSSAAAHGITYARDASFYDLIDEMVAKDTTIRSTLELVVASVLKCEDRFVAADDKPETIEMRNTVERAFREMPSDFDFDAMRESLMMCTFSHGFSVNEIVWEPSGSASNAMMRPHAFLHQHPGLFSFSQLGHLMLSGNRTGISRATPAEENKYVLMRKPGLYSNPFGDSVIFALRFLYYFKKDALKSWVRFADKYGFPLAVIKLMQQLINDTTGAKDQVIAQEIELLRGLTDDNGVVLAHGEELEFIQRQAGQSQSPHKELVTWMSSEEIRMLLGSTLSMMEAEFGTRAQAETHQDTSAIRLKPMARKLARAVTRGAVDAFMRVNYGPAAVGRVWYEMDTDESIDVQQAIEIINTATGNGVMIRETQFRQWLGLETPEDGEAVIAGKATDIFQYHLTAGVVTKNEARARLGLEPVAGGDVFLTPEEIAAMNGGGNAGAAEFSESSDVKKKPRSSQSDRNTDSGNLGRGILGKRKKPVRATAGLETAFARRLEKIATEAHAEYVAEITPVLKAACESMANTDPDKPPRAPGKVKISGPVDPLRMAVASARLMNMLYWTRLLPLAAPTPNVEFSATSDISDLAGKTMSEAAQWMLDREIMSVAEVRELAETMAANNPSMTAAEYERLIRQDVLAIASNDQLTQRFRDTVSAAVESGNTSGEFLEAMDGLIDSGALPAGADGYMDMVFRTETANAYAQEREERFKDPLLKDNLWGFEFFAVTDSRARPSHRAMDGVIVKRGSAADLATQPGPPWAYQCRCSKSPIIVSDIDNPGVEETPDALSRAKRIERF